MAQLDVRRFSEKYSVRRLTPRDAETVYGMVRQNTWYYAFCGRETSVDELLRDMEALPPGKTAEDKYYVGFFAGDELRAVMDLIDGYPDGETAYIGFFMMHSRHQGRGEGTGIITELAACLRRMGFAAIRLGYDKANPQSSHFWKKNGFIPLREADMDGCTIVVAERRLTPADA